MWWFVFLCGGVCMCVGGGKKEKKVNRKRVLKEKKYKDGKK